MRTPAGVDIICGMQKTDFVPTREEFEEAKSRELARLNVRVSAIKGEAFHTPKDLELLERDDARQRTADMVTVQQWTNRSAE